MRYDEFHLQFLLRLTPLNPATLSYLLGAAGVRFWGFLIVGVIVLFFLSRAARRAVGRAIEKSKREHSEVVGKPLAS